MINQEMIENPVLEEQSKNHRDRPITATKTLFEMKRKKFRRSRNPIRSMSSMSERSSINIWIRRRRRASQEREVSERPSFEKFLSSPAGLTEHLTWQLSVTICSDSVRDLVESIIGNLDENGYLMASTEELTQNGKFRRMIWMMLLRWCRISIQLASAREICANVCCCN